MEDGNHTEDTCGYLCDEDPPAPPGPEPEPEPQASCDATMGALCDSKRRKDYLQCLECMGANQATMAKAGCNDADYDDFCSSHPEYGIKCDPAMCVCSSPTGGDSMDLSMLRGSVFQSEKPDAEGSSYRLGICDALTEAELLGTTCDPMRHQNNAVVKYGGNSTTLSCGDLATYACVEGDSLCGMYGKIWPDDAGINLTWVRHDVGDCTAQSFSLALSLNVGGEEGVLTTLTHR
jgi:hypothetical protein